MFLAKRELHTSIRLAARTRYTKPKPKQPVGKPIANLAQKAHHSNDLRVTAPIPPATSNVQVPDDHPLWQFFADKKYMRKFDELDTDSRPWTVAELRRKSFDDLHSLWYTCLKERNVLARENHLLRNDIGSNQEIYETVAEKIRTTMWRIRHVLSERDHAFDKAQKDFDKYREGFLQDFEQEFLATPASEDQQAFEKLARLQFSIFGISEYIDENRVDRKFVDGMKYVATLKLKRFAARNADIESILEGSNYSISDAGEAFVIFTAENTESAAVEACQVVQELREKKSTVKRYDELDTVGEYVQKLAAAQAEQAAVTTAEL
ncbi:LAMI_0H01398g1_1 [Lachancea mirantina]|uniref:Large ribosomal subunit protein uL29m n=1 Tax=Lachancea mirantina TaxID=1230905 RepID=A0A1G4KE28_9SACH|nr:LAMI_0H01398g1_1 [Lachancea mirantina]